MKDLLISNKMKNLALPKPWYVYIIECSTGDLYVGITKDVNERVVKHDKGTACRYTKYRRPVKLIYIEQHTTRSEATKREIAVKKYSHRKKLELAGKK
jgi:predicted GIY-YIG superfamily endonuclease